MSNSNVALVQSMYAAFGRADIAALLGMLDPQIDWTVNGKQGDYPVFGTWKTPANVQKFFELVAQYENFTEFSPKDFYVTDDKVFVLGHYAGTIRTTGKPFATDWVHIFTVRNGKVISFREFNDSHQIISAYRG